MKNRKVTPLGKSFRQQVLDIYANAFLYHVCGGCLQEFLKGVIVFFFCKKSWRQSLQMRHKMRRQEHRGLIAEKTFYRAISFLNLYFRLSGFRHSNSGMTNIPSFLTRTSSNQISPPPYSGLWIITRSQWMADLFPLEASS